MKRIKLLVGFVVALVFLVAVSAPAFSADGTFLDDVWLKCKVNAKGYTHDPGTGAFKRQNGSITAYLHFVWNAGNYYDVAVWTDPGTGWANTSNSTAAPVLQGENFISNFFLQFVFDGTDYIDTYHTPFIKYSGNNGKVTYKGTGEVYQGSFEGDTLDYYGYFNIHGTSVDSTKLPFDPLM